jgi:exodeoxyribonuclease-3
MKIVTWNVNSVRTRKPLVLEWVKENKPDVLLLQETKCLDEFFPREEFEDLGYNIATHGQKTFNGVAILSLHPIDDINTDLPNTPLPEHARYIEAVVSVAGGAVRVASVYVPNGDSLDSDKFQDKLKFYDALKVHLAGLLEFEEVLVVGGDFNVAPEEIDTYSVDDTIDSVLFDIQARKQLRSLIALGMYDAYRMTNPNDQQFSWWDYRRGAWNKNQGLRIDHLLLSPEAADKLKDSEMDHQMRGKDSPSDHIPVLCNLSF